MKLTRTKTDEDVTLYNAALSTRRLQSKTFLIKIFFSRLFWLSENISNTQHNLQILISHDPNYDFFLLRL